MASISSAIGTLFQSIAAIGAHLLNSAFAVIQAIVALLQDLVGSVVQLVQSIVEFCAHFFQGVFGFVAANFFGLLLVGGVYYWYTHRGGQVQSKPRKRIA